MDCENFCKDFDEEKRQLVAEYWGKSFEPLVDEVIRLRKRLEVFTDGAPTRLEIEEFIRYHSEISHCGVQLGKATRQKLWDWMKRLATEGEK